MELYRENRYLKECSANIVSIQDRFVVFDQTIFYPGCGGQPCDRGVIKQGDDETYNILTVKKQLLIVIQLAGTLLHYQELI
ncbi:alanine--tRNA ligase-related protein [Peribacillus sp. NPDC058002]|uniref:alanine--tRNA ligase-related protein n=1 Tax=Peribacillus sp. NPDC058002 TaxID=3346301 RepID=UPI0036DAD238